MEDSSRVCLHSLPPLAGISPRWFVYASCCFPWGGPQCLIASLLILKKVMLNLIIGSEGCTSLFMYGTQASVDTSLHQSPRTKLLKTPRAILLFFVKYITLCSYLSFIEHYSEVWVFSLRREVVFLFYFNFLSCCLSLWLFVLYPTLKLTFQPCFAALEYVDALFLKKIHPPMQKPSETRVRSLGSEDSLEKEIAHNSSIVAGRISWAEEPGGLWSTRLQRVRHE